MFKDTRLPRVFFLCMFFFLILIFWDARNALADSGDFAWCESRLLLLHLDPYHMGRAWDSLEKSLGGDGQHYYLPSGLLLFWPFAFLNWVAARDLWLICNLCMTFSILWLLREFWLKNISFLKFTFFAMAACASRPWREVVGAGQQTFFALFFLLLGYKMALAKRPVWAGILLQCSLVKYTLTLPVLVWMSLSGFPVAVGIAVLAQVPLFLFSSFWLAMSPWGLAVEYVRFLRHASTLGDTDISVLVAGFRGLRHPRVWVFSFLAVTFIVLIRWLWGKKRDPLAVFSAIFVWSLLAVYHGDYDMCALVFPLAILAREGVATRWHATLAIALAWLWYIQIVFVRFRLETEADLSHILIFAGLTVIFCCLIFMPGQHSQTRSSFGSLEA